MFCFRGVKMVKMHRILKEISGKVREMFALYY